MYREDPISPLVPVSRKDLEVRSLSFAPVARGINGDILRYGIFRRRRLGLLCTYIKGQ